MLLYQWMCNMHNQANSHLKLNKSLNAVSPHIAPSIYTDIVSYIKQTPRSFRYHSWHANRYYYDW